MLWRTSRTQAVGICVFECERSQTRGFVKSIAMEWRSSPWTKSSLVALVASYHSIHVLIAPFQKNTQRPLPSNVRSTEFAWAIPSVIPSVRFCHPKCHPKFASACVGGQPIKKRRSSRVTVRRARPLHSSRWHRPGTRLVAGMAVTHLCCRDTHCAQCCVAARPQAVSASLWLHRWHSIGPVPAEGEDDIRSLLRSPMNCLLRV